jgi:hypothetical protein
MSKNQLPKLLRKKAARYSIVVVLLLLIIGIYAIEMRLNNAQKPTKQPSELSQEVQPNHQKVRATVFWVGEPPDADNANITNVASSWTGDWVKAFGGIDTYNSDGKGRCGYNPCGFTPKENPFYFALPYNDRDDKGNLKPASELKRIPWYSGPALEDQSLLKNRWIAVTNTTNGKTSYAQWEDVGPFNEDDIDYVFGDKAPKYKAGLDLSPAMDTYLNLDGEGTVSWRFIDASAVPDGPWKTTVTTSQLNYN